MAGIADALGLWGIVGLGFIGPMVIALLLMASSRDEEERRGWSMGLAFLFAIFVGFAAVVILRATG